MTAPRSAQIRIGVSGWRYPPWRGHFYPEKLRQADELAYLSRAFPVSEINGTFYSLQRPESFMNWADATPPGFVFTVKAPRYITHIRRLKDIDGAVANFYASGLLALGDKLGPILWQFPPSLPFDPTRFEPFLAALPRSTGAALRLARRHEPRMEGRVHLKAGADRPMRHAVEVRHESFMTPDFLGLLREHEVAAVLSDTPNPWPRFFDVTSDFLYLRLHGTTELYQSRYTPGALQAWADRIAAYASGGAAPAHERLLPAAPKRAGRDVFCFFDNTDKLHAPDNAGQLIQLLGVAPVYEDGEPVGWPA